MVPFRVFDRNNKTTWIVLNHQPGNEGGTYLVAREDDSERDGEMSILSASEISGFRLVDFYDEQD